MKNNLLPSIRLTLVCIVLFCGLYTLTVYGISKIIPKSMAFEKNSSGYYEIVGQSFTGDQYFNSRPSAVGYNAASSGGSNKGPSNPAYLEEVKARIDTFLVHNPEIRREEIPSDLVTASGSGIDPHISVQAAKVQVKRIARIRQINENILLELIDQQKEKRLFGLLGTESIHVLNLNLQLDKITKRIQ